MVNLDELEALLATDSATTPATFDPALYKRLKKLSAKMRGSWGLFYRNLTKTLAKLPKIKGTPAADAYLDIPVALWRPSGFKDGYTGVGLEAAWRGEDLEFTLSLSYSPLDGDDYRVTMPKDTLDLEPMVLYAKLLDAWKKKGPEPWL